MTHQHVCACRESWFCTKRDCDIPGCTDCTQCALTKHETWAQSSGYIRVDREDDHESRRRLYGSVSQGGNVRR